MTDDDKNPSVQDAQRRAERACRTRELLNEAARASTPSERRALLAAVAALNLDLPAAVVVSLSARHRGPDVDPAEVLRRARIAYAERILDGEIVTDGDLAAHVVPAVRDAVTRYLRALAEPTSDPRVDSSHDIGSRPGTGAC